MTPTYRRVYDILLASDPCETVELLALVAVEAIEQRDRYQELFSAALERNHELMRVNERQRDRIIELRGHRPRRPAVQGDAVHDPAYIAAVLDFLSRYKVAA